MKSAQAEQLIDKIDQSVEDIDGFINISDLEKSYLAKFLAVFICGIYEEIIEGIVNERIDNYHHDEVSEFIKDSVHKIFRNPDIKNIKGLLGRFSNNWNIEIDSLSENAKTAINNIVENKNAVAHGTEITLTLEDIKKYYIDSKEVIEKIDDMLLPTIQI